MDAGFRDKDGYIAVMSRTDDVINVAGHRLSAGAIEEVVCPYCHVRFIQSQYINVLNFGKRTGYGNHIF